MRATTKPPSASSPAPLAKWASKSSIRVLIEQPPRLVAIDTASWARLAYDIQASDAKRILKLFDSGRIAPFLTEFHVEELVRHEDDCIFRRRVELIRSLPFVA